jgi:hypothetical protein
LKILGTTEISSEIENLLDRTEKFLVLVTPYLKLNQKLKARLADAFRSVEQVYILHRENELNTLEEKWLQSFDNIKIFPIKNLHSKIYVNEAVMLIASMDLHEHSQINNHEIGIKLNYAENKKEYTDTLNEIRIMLESQYSKSYHQFDDIVERTERYSMNHLFWTLNKNHNFRNHNKGSQGLYEYISDQSRTLVPFNDNELYEDKTAVLRAAELGKKRYQLLEKELKKLSN